jgi:hypothetical protein
MQCPAAYAGCTRSFASLLEADILKPIILASTLLLALFALPVPATDAPVYTAKGNLVMPTNYREWVFLTSGIDMSYTATGSAGHSIFDNVFVNPTSYKAYVATGVWPDKTTFILEVRGAEDPVSINKRGHTQSTEIMGTEIHVKDNGKWSFYDLPSGAAEADLIPPPATCYTCHESHAASDTTFVQFYPTLLPIAKQKQTLSAAYLKEIATPAK